MILATDVVNEISRNVAAEHSPGLDVVGILSAGGSERIELLVAMSSHQDDEPRRYMLTLPRTDASQFEAELRSKLNEVVRNHVA
jgi:hypothetical protein